MKSNITVAANIFNRADQDIRRDPDFVAQVKGRPALRILKSQYGGTLSRVQLSPWQRRMCDEDSNCCKAHSGEKTHGLVRKDGCLVWEGRCEYVLCPRFNQCTETAHFSRSVIKHNTPAVQKVTGLTYEWLGDIERLFKAGTTTPPPEEITPSDSVIEDVKTFVQQDEYEEIDNPARIIGSGIDSKILVNAAPGSGKTYTVMRRLEHVIRNRLANDFSSILVLVYTNAAKHEILSRLETGVQTGTLPPVARNIDVCTFDSLATSYLATIETSFSHLDYDGRIKLFNEMFQAEDFSTFEYVIVDELQDLVNERAMMVLNILGALRGGYLLLGDKCQAIYDYDCHGGNKINSVEFYRRLNQLLPSDTSKYELIGNQRQTDKLAALSDNLRYALLEFDPLDANQLVAEEMQTVTVVGGVEQFDFSRVAGRAALLCRNNGEAEYVSHLLHKKKVPHTLLRSIGQAPSLHRFIADCLWDYREAEINKSAFVARYYARVSDDEAAAASAFGALSEAAYGDIKQTIEIEKLTQALRRPTSTPPALLLNWEHNLLVVSTIHKAKGREFDTVYLLNNGIAPAADNTEESRVWYVGCTRAKTSLHRLTCKGLYLRRSLSYGHRWMQLNHHRVKWTQKLLSHCRNIALGLTMDISEAGFVQGDFPAALKMQEYIAGHVQIGDEVNVELVNNHYLVKHQQHVVGCLSADLPDQLLALARESNPASDTPPYLSPVYISNIVTVVPTKFPESAASYFRKSGFWLGLEISGFPKIDWHYTPHAVTSLSASQ